MENNDDVEAKENRTLTNEGILPEASREDNASADRERETDIKDHDASEIIEIKQVDPGDQFDLERTEDIRRRNLKEMT